MKSLFHGLISALLCLAAFTADAARPNILWLTSEDHGPEMGCYGDKFATTPNIDKLAARGMIYTRAWSGAPVCAPARTTLITGMYASSSGGEHMRSHTPFPAGRKMFPQYLREAGYYCSNNSKEDYNHAKPGQVWDESSPRAHWRKRTDGQPFFSVFNSTRSHESQLRRRPHQLIHDPAKVRVPAYHPDTPEVRRDWAQYYDVVSEADADAGKVLAQLESDGLSDDTIIFYFGDHGSGMPRSKRWAYNSGLRVPLVVYIPEKFKDLRPPEYKPGGSSDRLVGFVDFGPTVLSLAGIKPPEWMQGGAFMGRFIAESNEFLHGFRARMDERPDLVRSVTDGRYVYVRNYMPHLIYGQHLNYMWQTPTTPVWERLFKEGKLNPIQQTFWKPKPPEELYDYQNDRDEVNNLASSPEHQAIKSRLREAQQDHARKIRDLGFLPEMELFERANGGAPFDLAQDERQYPFARVFEIAELASARDVRAVPKLKAALKDPHSAVRYWAALGFLMRGEETITAAQNELRAALRDESPAVRITAAEGLARADINTRECVELLMEHADWSKHGVFSAIAALNSLYALDAHAAPLLERIQRLPVKGPAPHTRYASYVSRLINDLVEKHSGQAQAASAILKR